MRSRIVLVETCVVACSLFLAGCSRNESVDEAKAARLTTADFPQITTNVFRELDGGIELSPDEIMGRNTWILWSAGDDRFWDRMARDSYGMIDLLKTLDSRKYPRNERFKTLGLINQPGFRARSPDNPDEFGLCLDEPVRPESSGIDEKIYGKASGVIGLRLFPNPEFNEEARKEWDGKRFMDEEHYYDNDKLVRPYRVGVACGVCHVSFNPAHPPVDPENPDWNDLASAIGNQFIREGKVFGCNLKSGSFIYEQLHAQPPGTSDTSRVATDHINNPNAINPIFLLAERERIAAEEEMAGGTLALPGTKEELQVPHILKDGADSIGVAGAALRVYVNIGMFSEYWLTQHDRLIGSRPQKPFEIPYAREHSVYWQATEERVGNIRAFFRKLKPFRLANAPGGAEYITRDETMMTRGKEVFAANCAGCHSSKQPPTGMDPRSGRAIEWFRREVLKPDFLENNFLSNDQRYPVTLIKTNSARAFASNAMPGQIWDNFSSQTYKELPVVDPMEFYNPFEKTNPIRFDPRLKKTGPGYYRVPSLVNLWSSAPFLHNNSLGKFTGDPSVAGRMEAFNDAVEKLLWPEKRLGKDSIWRTENDCWLQLRKEFAPPSLRKLADKSGHVRLGPIPKGFPVNLIANLEPDAKQMPRLMKIAESLAQLSLSSASPESIAAEFRRAVPEFYAANKCPDFVEDEGHYFGATLVDEDKLALIEYLKTF